MPVEEAGAVHLPWRTVPVQAKGQGQPAALRTEFFLADIVGPAAAGLADATAEHEHVDQPAVVHVHVVPVVHRRTDDDHRASTGLVGVVGKLAGDLDRLLATHTGDLLLPGRGARHRGVVIVLGNVGAAQATVDRQVGRRQVEHGGDFRHAAIGQHHAVHRHPPELHRVTGHVLEVLLGFAGEVRERHFGDVAADQAQLEVDLTPSPPSRGRMFHLPFSPQR